MGSSPSTAFGFLNSYFVHLVAPGWNVIGGGEPVLPGVSIGHNEYFPTSRIRTKATTSRRFELRDVDLGQPPTLKLKASAPQQETPLFERIWYVSYRPPWRASATDEG